LSRRGRPSPVLSLPRDVVGVACRRGVVFMFMFVHESPRPVVGSRDCRLQLLPLLLLLLPSRAGSHIGIVAQHAGALAGVILSSWRVTDLRWAWAAFRCETRAQPSSHGVGTASSPVCPLIRRHSLCVQASRDRCGSATITRRSLTRRLITRRIQQATGADCCGRWPDYITRKRLSSFPHRQPAQARRTP